MRINFYSHNTKTYIWKVILLFVIFFQGNSCISFYDSKLSHDYIVSNNTDETIIVFSKFYDNGDNYNVNKDTIDTIYSGKSQIIEEDYIYNYGKSIQDWGFDKETGKANYLDSIKVFLLDGATVNKNLLYKTEWIFVEETETSASYFLTINESDFE